MINPAKIDSFKCKVHKLLHNHTLEQETEEYSIYQGPLFPQNQNQFWLYQNVQSSVSLVKLHIFQAENITNAWSTKAKRKRKFINIVSKNVLKNIIKILSTYKINYFLKSSEFKQLKSFVRIGQNFKGKKRYLSPKDSTACHFLSIKVMHQKLKFDNPFWISDYTI